MENIYVQINKDCLALQESISDIRILQESIDIGIGDQNVLNESIGDFIDKVKAVGQKIMGYVNGKIEDRKKKQALTAKYAEVLKAAKKLTVNNDTKVKLHEGANVKMAITLPSTTPKTYYSALLGSMKNSQSDNDMIGAYGNGKAKTIIQEALAYQTKEIVRSFTKSEVTAKESIDAVKQFYLGDVTTVTPSVSSMVFNLSNAPKTLITIDRSLKTNANNVYKYWLDAIDKLSKAEPDRKGLQLAVSVFNATANNMIRINDTLYDIVYTIAEEDYSALRKLAGEMGAINESVIEAPEYDEKQAEETTPAIVYADAVGTGKEGEKEQSSPNTVGSVLTDAEVKDVKPLTEDASSGVIDAEHRTDAGAVAETNSEKVNQAAVGASGDNTSTEKVSPDTVGSVLTDAQTKEVQPVEGLHESVIFDNVLSLLETQTELLGRGLNIRPLTEAVDVDMYFEHMTLLEAVDSITIDKESISEAKEGKPGKIKAALSKIATYFFSLDPEKKGKALPKIIKTIVTVVLSVVGIVIGVHTEGLGAVAGAGVKAAGTAARVAGVGTTVAGVAVPTIGAVGGAVVAGALVTVAVTVLLKVINNFMTNVVNSKDVDATITSIEARIKEINTKLEADNGNKDLTKLRSQLEAALPKLKAIKDKKDAAEAKQKPINEDASSGVIDASTRTDAGQVATTTAEAVNQAAVGASGDNTSSVQTYPTTVGSVLTDAQSKEVKPVEGLNESAIFDNVLALLESQMELIDRGLTIRPLTEAVDIDTYYEHMTLLEAVDQLSVDKEAVTEAKEGKTGKLKAAISKITKYFFSLDPDKKGKILPRIIKTLVYMVLTGAAGVAVGTVAGPGSSLVAGVIIGSLLQIINDFVTKVVNYKDVELSISTVESKISVINSKLETDKKNKDLIKLKTTLEAALAKLKNIKNKKDVDDAGKKPLNEDASSGVIDAEHRTDEGATAETNSEKVNQAAVGASGDNTSSVQTYPTTVGSVLTDAQANQVKPVEGLNESATVYLYI